MTDTLTAPAPTPQRPRDRDWWRQASVYQIYPRSFADANGDGIGDLRGIIDRVPYLQTLGIDAVWLSPFYPSALADGGYDVDDYRDVDPTIGTLEEFDELVAALHAAGIKVIVDIVPNHTSDRHAWFQEALAAPKGSPARDRYVIRDGRGQDGELPPSDWESGFGGPAWHPMGDGQWYHHYFAPEQPDLNWANQEVREDFLTTLRFWSDRGVDGFRVDVAHGLAKDLPEQLPTHAELLALEAGTGEHPMWDRDEVHEIYADWRQVLNSYDPPRTAVAEAWVATPERRARYASPQGLGQAFNFDLLEADFDATAFREVVTDNLAQAAASGSSTTWVLSNHDVVRHPTRYALQGKDTAASADVMVRFANEWLRSGGTTPAIDPQVGARRARAATAFMLALPGSAYLYQGEELGLEEVAAIPQDRRQDPTFLRTGGEQIGRDGCRVPLPWSTTGPSYGFGSSAAHLPQPESFGAVSVEAQSGDPEAPLELYRRALALRAQLQTDEELTWEPAPEGVLHFSRPGGWHVVTTFGTEPAELPAGEVVLTTRPLVDGRLPGEATAWVRTAV
ncbi:alpha-glucosidase [Barrientosiimonas humi]|uniref:Alpha-glucosidase n=1 Tax=Barrientosiimonas humi TaxID=999931 RepID=A0A542XDE9_9MICO|nr:glycoside hydrolase family 13 protein [Barrientosiimonas humi]TQL33859.1 alpha-glucosidase [Barrientosiimonas humi]CAG7573850.1 Oligo-1,6-glucosidase [Barrientosiimonas humi]